MKKLFLGLFVVCLFLGTVYFSKTLVLADEESDLKEQIAGYETKITELQKQADSLGKEISLMDNQIKITSLKISQTLKQINVLEQEILDLSGKIVRLDGSLNDLSKVLLERVEETYKSKRVNTLALFFSSKNFSDFISRFRYLQAVQLHDRQLLLSMEQTRTNYDEQKQLKEQKQKELEKLQKQLEQQKISLNSQIADRKRLLEETKGKETVYQQLLAQARAELQAIIGILAGEGNEVKVKDVSEGEKIASVISGASCNSSGTHLHFMIARGNDTKNPFDYLKSGIDYENCSAGSCGSGGDSFAPAGNWNWPVNPKITLTQGYGYTWAIQHTWVGRIYKFHNGIDIKGSSSDIYAPKTGTLYRGSFIGKTCTLRYVKVHHNNEDLDTYYLHINF